jgi:hypothetical protein
MALTTFGRNVALRGQFGADRGAAAPGTLYVALSNGDLQSGGIEPAGVGGYARVAVPNDATFWGVIAAGSVSCSNVSEILYPVASGLWSQPTVTHWALYDNNSGGNLILSGKLTTATTMTGNGDIVRIPAGSLTLTQAG